MWRRRWTISSLLLLIAALALVFRLFVFPARWTEIEITNNSGAPLSAVEIRGSQERKVFGTVLPGQTVETRRRIPAPSDLHIVFRREGANRATTIPLGRSLRSGDVSRFAVRVTEDSLEGTITITY